MATWFFSRHGHGHTCYVSLCTATGALTTCRLRGDAGLWLQEAWRPPYVLDGWPGEPASSAVPLSLTGPGGVPTQVALLLSDGSVLQLPGERPVAQQNSETPRPERELPAEHWRADPVDASGASDMHDPGAGVSPPGRPRMSTSSRVRRGRQTGLVGVSGSGWV